MEGLRKKRFWETETLPLADSPKVRMGAPGWATRLSMILSTGLWLAAVWALQKSSAVALA